MTRVAVIGAAGRMGTAACAAVHADPELELVAAVDSSARPGATTAQGLAIARELREIGRAHV